jgi:HTH-type transcriptional regulator/antitoxin HipB
MRIRAPGDIAAAVRGRRLDLGLTQAAVATHAGVSRKWVYEFEAGKPSAELDQILRVLDALDLTLDVVAA